MANNIDILLTVLNKSGIQQTNNALYQVISQLIKLLKELQVEIGGISGGSGGSSTTIINEYIQQIIYGDDGIEGEIGPPGIRGIDGVIGRDGNIGPPGLEGDQGEEGFAIPGQQGIQGIPGITGAAGPPTLGPMGLDGDQGEESIPIPGPKGDTGSAGASANWTLIEARTCTGNATEPFTGLSAYSEILIIASLITKSVSGIVQVQLSIDNGANYLTTSGDYQSQNTAGSGALNNQTAIDLHSSSTTAARSGNVLIEGFNVSGSYKTSKTTSALPDYMIPNTTPFDALRVIPSGGGNLNAGTIYLLGR